ncbi:hypothetical protein KCM76_17820 [Zooshikella marina]|nr:hypothetical protein [Zooshikella ganghwensis]MBU2707857.1 hypothetical protein [Zooshikella ganghwensis]
MQCLNSFVPPAAEDHPWSLLLTVLLAPVSQTNSSIANPLCALPQSRLNS